MGKTVVLATNNEHKAREIRDALAMPGWKFCTLKELGIESDPEEDADSFEGNARIKAVAAHRASKGMPALADDSGLMVDALDGAPGVFSARYAGGHGDDTLNNARVLRELEGVAAHERTARFVCSLVFIDEDGGETTACGTVEGRIGYAPQGEGGFGYDPLFWPDVFGGEKTLAEVTQDEKSSVSHRGNALRALRQKLVG